MAKLKSTYYRLQYTHTNHTIELPNDLTEDLKLFLPSGFLSIIVRRLLEKFLAGMIRDGFKTVEVLFSEDDMQVKHIVKSLREMTQEELVEKISQIRNDRRRERPGTQRKQKVRVAKDTARANKGLIEMFAGLTEEEQAEVLRNLGVNDEKS